MEVRSRDLEKYLANPSLRISAGSDWESLIVRTRREPARCRYLSIPATPDPWLVLTTGGGPRKTEVRSRNGWSSAFSGPGNLALTSPGKSTEIRWDQGDGSGIETIHVSVDAALFHQFAAENFECDPARIEIIDGFAQHDALISSVVNLSGINSKILTGQEGSLSTLLLRCLLRSSFANTAHFHSPYRRGRQE